MNTKRSKQRALGPVAVLVLILTMAQHGRVNAEDTGPGASKTELRRTTPLMDGWRFTQDDALSDDAALASNASDWQAVKLPHTWNAEDAAGLHVTKPYKRGLGWYRLEFDAPGAGARHWLEFGAASIVADVWLNGKKLGEHKGAFTVFRFDVTDRLAGGGKKNVLLVKTDSHAPKTNMDRTAIIPLEGDFNMSGGLYRHVALISTIDTVHVDLGDMGGPGVYATTASIANGGATVRVLAKLKSDASEDGDYIVRASLLDAEGRVAGSAQARAAMTAGASATAAQELKLDRARLWQGVDDPYLYTLVVDVLRPDGGTPVDRVVQPFGIRQVRFDPDEGCFLNGRHVRLHGVAIHQDYLGKAWAVTDKEIDESLAMAKEIGANTIRLGHYPFSRHALDVVDRLGLVAWAEVPFGLGVTVQAPIELGRASSSCPSEDATPEFRANAQQQLRELIRQQYNHASIAMWSIGNETTFMAKDCPVAPYDNITPVLRELQAVAKQEDPGRATTLADFTSKATPPLQGGYIAVGGISDIWAINQYYLWYSGPVWGLGDQLDALHARYPNQAIGMSEYGAGAALTHHTDNVLGGPAEVTNTGVPVVYQPEEYAAYVHEQNYALILTKQYLWGTYVWNMFDFGSGLRNEGDLRGVNTKGIVTFDRKTRKDPFFFYKANWSRGPVTYVTGRRYTERAYAVADVKVYSNAQAVQLSVNDRQVGSIGRDQAVLNTYVFRDVKLSPGRNRVVATGDHGGKEVADSVEWSLDTNGDVNIAAGQLATGLRSAAGARFGSDNFFTGGTGDWLVEKGTRGVTDPTPVSGTSDPHLFSNYRRGRFSYLVPLENGRYQVTLGFVEPARTAQAGYRVFDVVANGAPQLRNFDVLRTAGAYRTAVTRTFTVDVTGGQLKLDFLPVRDEAVVSNISIRRQG
jgi:beta-galactosidase